MENFMLLVFFPQPAPIYIPTTRSGVALHQLMKSDAEALFELVNRNLHHVNQYGNMVSEECPDIEATRRSIPEPRPNWTRQRFGIWDRRVGLVGHIELGKNNSRPDRIMLGYWVGSEFLRQGYAFTAVRALVNHVFLETSFTHVAATVHRDNLPSKRVLEKAGFNFNMWQNVMREYVRKKDPSHCD